jgi:hypothetical protein
MTTPGHGMNERQMNAMIGALADIEHERLAQHEKWGQQNHSLPIWLLVLQEEIGEFSQACLAFREAAGEVTHTEDPSMDRVDGAVDLIARIRGEAVQVAAVGCAIIEHIDRVINSEIAHAQRVEQRGPQPRPPAVEEPSPDMPAPIGHGTRGERVVNKEQQKAMLARAKQAGMTSATELDDFVRTHTGKNRYSHISQDQWKMVMFLLDEQVHRLAMTP